MKWKLEVPGEFLRAAVEAHLAQYFDRAPTVASVTVGGSDITREWTVAKIEIDAPTPGETFTPTPAVEMPETPRRGARPIRLPDEAPAPVDPDEIPF